MTTEAADSPLLTHAFYTDPNPLESSFSGPSDARVTLLVTNGGWSPVRCTEITVTFPVGQRARDLAASARNVMVVSVPEGWEAPDPVRTNKYVLFTFTPLEGSAVITADALPFVFFPVSVNSTVGVAYPQVTETTAIDDEQVEERRITLRLPKFPVGDRSGEVTGTNLAVFAEQHTEGDPPLVRVARGRKVTVAWTPAPGLARSLHWQDRDEGCEIADGAGSLVCGPLHQDTTFTLQTVSQAGGETVNRYDSVTVAVDVPSHPKITVTDDDVPVDSSAAMRIDGRLTIRQSLTARAGARVTSDLTAKETLCTPQIELGGLRFAGTVDAARIDTASGLTAARVAAQEGLTASGDVLILRAGWEELPDGGGTRTMITDGIVVVTAHGGPSDLTLKVTFTGGGEYTYATTTVGGFGNLVAPVPAGQDVTWGVEGTPAFGQVGFYWFAFGV